MMGRVGADDDGRFLARRARALRRALRGRRRRDRPRLRAARRGRRAPQPRVAGDQRRLRRRPTCRARLPRTRFAYFSSFVGDKPLAAQLALLDAAARRRRRSPSTPARSTRASGVKRFMPLLKRCAYLFATETELEMLCGLPLPTSRSTSCSTPASGWSCARWAAAAPASSAAASTSTSRRCPAEVVDVTGAGDLFAAGFLGRLLEGLGLEAAGRLAAWAASRASPASAAARIPTPPPGGSAWPRSAASTKDVGRPERPR